MQHTGIRCTFFSAGLTAILLSNLGLAGPGDRLSGEYEAFNRVVQVEEEDGGRFLRLSETPGSGAAWLKDVEFSTGTIEVDIRGKNQPQHSFVGIAFHASDDETYEAVYFRPFNFRSPDPARQSHSVQYICHPKFGWSELRSAHPGVFENSLTPPPEPEDWFHARITVDNSKVRVYVNGGSEPVLEVDRLTERNTGRIGIWAGHTSGGDFKNLTIHPVDEP